MDCMVARVIPQRDPVSVLAGRESWVSQHTVEFLIRALTQRPSSPGSRQRLPNSEHIRISQPQTAISSHHFECIQASTLEAPLPGEKICMVFNFLLIFRPVPSVTVMTVMKS